jgi:hypothetical protein
MLSLTNVCCAIISEMRVSVQVSLVDFSLAPPTSPHNPYGNVASLLKLINMMVHLSALSRN